MRIDLKRILMNEQSGADICVDNTSDYAILYKIIKIGDIIKTNVRRKDKSLKIHILHADASLLVEKIEYIIEPEETIHIVGTIIESDEIYIPPGTRLNFWVIDGCKLELIKNKWESDELDLLKNQSKKTEKHVERDKMISDRDLQEKCFDILHKYIVKNYSLIIYGNESFEALENGAVKVLLVTEEFIKRQNDRWKNILSNENHKYHGSNIVVYDKGTNNFEELTSFGGIIGVLKYKYVPSQIEEN